MLPGGDRPVSAPPIPLPGRDGGITLVTGPRGSGKSSLCMRWAVEARRVGMDVAGLVTLGIWTSAEKTGLQALDLRAGERRGLARLAAGAGGVAPLGRWAFDHETLEWGADVLRAACPTGLLVIDELGPLELLRSQGWHCALEVLQAGAFGAAVAVVRPSLVKAAQSVVPARCVIRLGGDGTWQAHLPL